LIPIVQREFMLVLSAQRSRGMKATGLGAAVPSIVPVFAGTIERVQQLSMSLESRAFGSKGEKTSLREVRARPTDYLLVLVGLVVTAALTYYLVTNRVALDWSEIAFIPTWLSIAIVYAAGLIFISIMAFLWWRSSR
jgi:energy-coupling factor transport system permease protein